jgi:hypothetical protein
MTEPIREKFDGLDENLQTRHNALMDLLAGIALDLTAPVDYSAAFASLGAKLDAILAALVDPFDGGAPVLTQLTGIRNDFGYLAARVDMVKGAVDISNNWLDSIMDTLGVKAPGAEFTLASLTRAQALTLVNIHDRLEGIIPPWPADVLAALQCICDATSSQVPPDPRDSTLPGACLDPWYSTGQVVLPWSLIGGTSQMFAVFDILPTGLSYGSTFGLTDDHSELDATDWTGWRVFVESDMPTYADGADLLGVARYPTNQWNNLDGTNPRAFSVDARGGIQVFLCPPGSEVSPNIPEGECLRFDVTGSEGQNWIVAVPNYPSNYTLTLSQPAYVRNSYQQEVFLNYGVAWTQEDTGPGPWSVLIGNTADPQADSYVMVCHPGPA